LTRACLARIASREETVGAWAYLNERQALDQARALDEKKQAGEPLAPLHGIPVGIKDIIDTNDMPTECGSALYAGRRPIEDSMVAALLRRAGAVIMGKTVTTEMALSAPGKTTNPHDPERTPGGSSSGSAAAVADHMVPLAIGSQTGGSVIRPASFCGVFGFKPTFGAISRRGVSMLARRLDHIGVYGRSVDDLALIGDVLMVQDPADWDMVDQPGKGLVSALAGETQASPRFAFVRGPVWDQAEPDMAAAIENFIRGLGDKVKDVELEGVFEGIVECHATIMNANLVVTLVDAAGKTPDKFRGITRKRVDAGRSITAASYIQALAYADVQTQVLDRLFDHYDVLLTPAAPGVAPASLETTGRAIFNGMWTLMGVPAVSVPLLTGENAMPIGVQVVGRRGGEAGVLKAAKWLWNQFGIKYSKA
jgi:Asp-tRNA(Asn)/Glu-tRNA(Gln) amidotransferase A subunit family amidase